ncbi:unnamed protein product [Hyaloperonospora brassicae]|uniref:Uncharacterized protein n=1 Tax=Hyaloperonospora brassicae TaxID=162125 RepID=A0AAV0U936_HYABA|nr:unnamed protein product [Hyaloperonospora brassicae]
MDAPEHALPASSGLRSNATGDARVFGLALNAVETHRAACVLLAFACCVLATLLSVYNIVQHLVHYSRPPLQRYIVRILAIVPVYALGSLLSLTFVHYALYLDSIRDCYEAFVVYSFLALILSFTGGESVCALKLQSEPDVRHLWPFDRCFDPLGRDGRLLRLCKRATIQFVFLKPLMAALSLGMLACGTYHTAAYQLVLVVVYNASYSVALYGLWLFYRAVQPILAPFRPVLKFFAVKGVVFLTFWQNSLLDWGVVPGLTHDQAVAWKDLILCVEMVLFAVVHLVAFNASQFKKHLDRLPDSEVLSNMKEVLSLSDILADAYHNFMPSYRDYVLQRGGETTSRARKSDAATGFCDPLPAAGDSPAAMAHANARAPRFVIDDEDDDDDEEGNGREDYGDNGTIAVALESSARAAAVPASTHGETVERELSAKKSESGDKDSDVVTANPQDDDQVKSVDADEAAGALEEGVRELALGAASPTADDDDDDDDDAASVETPVRQRSNSFPSANNVHDHLRHEHEHATL